MESQMSITLGKSVTELQDMQREIQQALRDARDERIAALRAIAQEIADDDKVSLEAFVRQNLLGEGKVSRMQSVRSRRGVLPPKYVDPNDPSHTWAGKGAKPAWLIKALDEGYTLDMLEVVQEPVRNQDSERPAAGYARA